MDKRVVVLLPGRIACYRKDHRNLTLEHDWSIANGELPSGFVVYLEDSRHAEFSLLLDLPEEECHLEQLKVSGLRDRKYLVERLKNKLFEKSLLSKASIIGDRKHASLLLSGVDANAICEKLLHSLEDNNISVRAIHSPITLTGVVARLADAKDGAQLFVIRLKDCYRLTACQDSVVLLTRRISVSTDEQDGTTDLPDSAALARVIEETLVYVQRSQSEAWIPSVVLIGFTCQAGMSQSLKELAVESKLIKQSIYFEYPVEGVDSPDLGAEALLVSATFRCGNGYAQQQHRRVYTALKVRNVSAALALCAAGGAISSVAIANKLNDVHAEVAQGYSQSASLLSSDIASIESSYEQPVEAVRQALVTARLVEMSSAYKPLEFLQGLATDVQQHADVSIDTVRWEVEEAVSETAIVDSLSKTKPLEMLHLEQIYHATLSGTVLGTPETALSEFESFVSMLRSANSDPSVLVVESPFGLGGSDKTTMSDFSGESGNFVLEISSQAAEQ